MNATGRWLVILCAGALGIWTGSFFAFVFMLLVPALAVHLVAHIATTVLTMAHLPPRHWALAARDPALCDGWPEPALVQTVAEGLEVLAAGGVLYPTYQAAREAAERHARAPLRGRYVAATVDGRRIFVSTLGQSQEVA